MNKFLAFVFLMQVAVATVAQVNSSQSPPDDVGTASPGPVRHLSISNVAPSDVSARGRAPQDSMSLSQCRNLERHAQKVPTLKEGAAYQYCMGKFGDLPDSAEHGVVATDAAAKSKRSDVEDATAKKKK